MKQSNKNLWKKIYTLMLRILTKLELYLNQEINIEDYEYEGLKNNLIKNNIYLGKSK